MNNKKLPESAYAALEGLKGQASAVEMMMNEEQSEAALKSFKASQQLMQENIQWVNKIVRALMRQSKDEALTVLDVDDQWLEKNLAVDQS